MFYKLDSFFTTVNYSTDNFSKTVEVFKQKFKRVFFKLIILYNNKNNKSIIIDFEDIKRIL